MGGLGKMFLFLLLHVSSEKVHLMDTDVNRNGTRY